MKIKKFKLIFPTIALIMAIIISLAFTPTDTNENSMEENAIAVWWYHNTPPNQPRCVPIVRRCDPINPGPVCTTFIPGVGFRQLFNVPNRNRPPGPQNPCNVILFRCLDTPND